MEVTLKPGGAAVIALGVIVLGLQTIPECEAQSASPYVPPPLSITISPQTNGATVSVAVDVALPDSCHSVSNWGQPLLVGDRVYVDAQFLRWPLICFPVIITVSTNYGLGTLPPGNYYFHFLAWGVEVKAEAFSVPEPSPPRLIISRLSSSQARLRWPTNAPNYSLECAMALTAPEWVTVTNRPPVIGDKFALTIDLPGGHKFYRLRRM